VAKKIHRLKFEILINDISSFLFSGINNPSLLKLQRGIIFLTTTKNRGTR